MSCRTEVAHFLYCKNIQVICVQKSKLSSTSIYPRFTNYTFLCRDRPGDRVGEGFFSLVHHSVTYTELPTDHFFSADTIIEQQGFTFIADDVKLTINNIYIPPNDAAYYPVKN